MGITLKSLGSKLPEKIVTNKDMMEIVNTNDEWIRERSGIEERRVAIEESNMDLAVAATEEALYNNGDPIDKETIDLIIYCTITPDQIVPAMSSRIKHRMGFENAIGFDVNAACSAFVYAAWMAESLMLTRNLRRALIITSERLTRLTNYNDRNTCILFGDGAGVAILENDSSKPGILGSFIKNYDDVTGSLYCGMNYDPIPFCEDEPTEMYLHMEGQHVFKFAVGAMTDAIDKVLTETGVSADEVKYYVPHQANKRIIMAAAKRFKQPLDKFTITIQKHGNVSAATVPIALRELYREKDIQPGDKIMIAGFGGGLSAAAMLIEA